MIRGGGGGKELEIDWCITRNHKTFDWVFTLNSSNIEQEIKSFQNLLRNTKQLYWDVLWIGWVLQYNLLLSNEYENYKIIIQ